MTIAFAPNDDGMSEGLLQLFIDEPASNMASRTYLNFYGIPYTEVTKIEDLGTKTRYTIVQDDGSSILFEIDQNQPAVGGYILGYPVGSSASSLTRVTYVDATGAPSNRAGATYLRQYFDPAGYADYPLSPGLAVRFVTAGGRTYSLPFPGIETIRVRLDGTLLVNGKYGDGVIRQAKTLAGLIDVVPLGERAYEVRNYAPQQLGPKVAGLYTANGNPIQSMRVEAPAGEANKLVITRRSGSLSAVTTHTVTTDPVNGQRWAQTIQMGEFGFERELVRKPDANLGAGYEKVTRKARLTAAPGMASPPDGFDYTFESTDYQYAPLQSQQTFRNGVQHVRGWEYGTPSWDASGLGRTTVQHSSTGTTITYGIQPGTQRMLSRVHQFQIPAGASGSSPMEKREDYDYAPLAAGEVVSPFDFRPRMTSVIKDGESASLRFSSYRTENGEYVETTEDSPNLSSGFGAAENRREESRYFGTGINQGCPREERHTDGTLTHYEYSPQPDGRLTITTIDRLSPGGTPVSGYSTRTTSLFEVRGLPLETTTAHWVDGGWLDFETILESYDVAGNLTGISRRDLLSGAERVHLEQEWDGPLLIRTVDERGVSVRFEYFGGSPLVKREIREPVPAQGNFPAQPEVVVTYSGTFQLDGNQLPMWERRVATTTAGNFTLTSTTVFDERGRVIEETDVNGYTTHTSNSPDGQIISVTLPSGGTEITERSSAGEILSITGTATIPQFYHRTPRAGGGLMETVFLAQDNGPRWSRTESDGNGRRALEAKPAFGGGEAQTIYHYDDGGCACGKPSKITRTGLPATVNVYNSVHELVRTGTTGDDEALSFDSQSDRIQDNLTTVERDGNRLWLVRRQAVYPQGGSASFKVVTTTRSLVAGFAGIEFQVEENADVSGNVTRNVVEVNRAASLETRRAIAPGATDAAVQVFRGGRLVAAHQPGSSGDFTFQNDALGRLIATKNPGHVHAETKTYEVGKERLASETDAAGNTTTYSYVPPGQPGAGSIQSVTAPDNGMTTTEYDLQGHVVKTYGARTYPVAYTYNAFGERETLTTWQDYAGNQGSAVTHWSSDPATGLVTAKTDAANKSMTYTYDVAGRLLTRTWARGLVTSYGYNPFGEPVSVDYNDTTPDVSFTYDRLGRQLSATTNGVAQSVYTYRADTLQPETETLRQDLDGNGTFDFERIFTRSQDALLRSTGFSLADGTSTIDTAVAYGYEPVAGRFASVILPDARSFTYAYDPARPGLIATVSGPAHRVVNTWEPDRDVLDVKSNQTLTGTVLSQYDYTVNGIGQRTAVETTGSAFTLLGGGNTNRGWSWGYDSLGQLIAANHASTTDFNRGYTYDTIGNRTQASSGAFPGAVVTAYSANPLNQYTAVGQSNPQYDDDGNQLSGALGQAAGKTFEWDGENRLKVIKDANGNVLATYAYDHTGRRVRRDAFDGSSTIFVYDGWNLYAEYSAGTSGVNLTKTHTWGLDLSGSLQGAGGVGGLLVSEAPGGFVSYPAYDGNANLTVIVDGNGTATGVYEYDPFGNVLSSAGATASANAFRFTSKLQDVETGWLYYGFRYYDPTTGRWESSDPVGEQGGINLYEFVGNAPITNNDVLGLITLPGEGTTCSTQDSKTRSCEIKKLVIDNANTEIGPGYKVKIAGDLEYKNCKEATYVWSTCYWGGSRNTRMRNRGKLRFRTIRELMRGRLVI